MYVLTDHCAWQRCISRWDAHPDEIFLLIGVMYFTGIFYLFLAIYLNEVVPQLYGVPKHPLFFMERFIQQKFPSLHS